MWSSCACVMHDAGEVGAVLLDEAHVGEDHVDAGIVLALGEGDAAVDHQPLARVGRPEAVEVGVHADLAEAAQRHEYELVAVRSPGLHHGPSGSLSLVVLLGTASGDAPASATSPKVNRRSRPVGVGDEQRALGIEAGEAPSHNAPRRRARSAARQRRRRAASQASRTCAKPSPSFQMSSQCIHSVAPGSTMPRAAIAPIRAQARMVAARSELGRRGERG